MHILRSSDLSNLSCSYAPRGQMRWRENLDCVSLGGHGVERWRMLKKLFRGQQPVFDSAVNSLGLGLVQSLSHVWLFVIPWTASHKTSLSITNSWNLFKLMSIESVMPSNHLILYCPFFSCLQSFPASASFPVSQFFTSGGQSIGISASASVLSRNIWDWFPLAWTGWISLQSKGLSRVFSNTTVQKHQLGNTKKEK